MINWTYRLIEDSGEKIKQIQIFKFENFEKLNKITLNPIHIFWFFFLKIILYPKIIINALDLSNSCNNQSIIYKTNIIVDLLSFSTKVFNYTNLIFNKFKS